MEEHAAQEFRMHGAREVIALGAGRIQIERHVVALEGAVTENPALALDFAKVLIESICKSVLADCGHPVTKNQSLPSLFNETLSKLDLLPKTYVGPAKVRESLERTAKGLREVVEGIGQLRNEEGFASHGRDGYVEQIEVMHAELAARAADMVLAYLYKCHAGRPIQHTGPTHDPEFDAYLDDTYSVEIEGVTFLASEIVFTLDKEAYTDARNRFMDERAAAELAEIQREFSDVGHFLSDDDGEGLSA